MCKPPRTAFEINALTGREMVPVVRKNYTRAVFDCDERNRRASRRQAGDDFGVANASRRVMNRQRGLQMRFARRPRPCRAGRRRGTTTGQTLRCAFERVFVVQAAENGLRDHALTGRKMMPAGL